MDKEVIEFPLERTDKHRRDQIDAVLSEDPNYRFILELLSAVASLGLPLDDTPENKTRSLYARYQRENRFAQWARELAAEKEQKQD